MDPVIINTLATSTTAFLAPYLVKAGEATAEKIGELLPEAVGKVWNAITTKFQGLPAAEEAVKNLAAKPTYEDNQASFRKELRKTLEADLAFADKLKTLLEAAEQATGQIILNAGSGAVATHGGVAAGAGGVAVQGDVHGGIALGAPKKGYD